MRIASISENIKTEKRIAITPEIAKKYNSNGFQVSITKNYGQHLGFNDKEYTHFIIPQFYEEEECDGQLKQLYQDDIQVELSATELWVGNANYATSFAMIIDNIRIPNQEWICKN